MRFSCRLSAADFRGGVSKIFSSYHWELDDASSVCDNAGEYACRLVQPVVHLDVSKSVANHISQFSSLYLREPLFFIH